MVTFPAPRAEDPDPLQPSTSSPTRFKPELDELTSRLAEQGIQSTDLVLDLVLHDFADEACQMAGATGAAIALERDGELVCRAAAGITAPDLGVRIQLESGLSGLCVKEGTSQICNDTDKDDRVDTQACRHLGVRSILVFPILDEQERIGVFEVFSARPHAFSSEHMERLASLAVSAGQTIKAAREKALARPELIEPPEPIFAPEVIDGTEPEIVSETSAPPSVNSVMQTAVPVDPAVKVLRWLVIGLALPLVVLIGFDWGWHRAYPATTQAVSNPEDAKAPEPSSDASTLKAPEKVEPSKTPAKPQQPSTPRTRPADALAARGGLVIYQNGKVVFREIPRHTNSLTKAPNGSVSEPAISAAAATSATGTNPAEKVEAAISPVAGVTGGRVLHSVSPQYPPEALLRNIEGSVVLHGTVETDGTIRDIKPVKGDPLLSAAAVEAVQQWRYEPYRKDGTPIAMPIDITIDFSLRK